MARIIHWKEATVALSIIFCFALLNASAQTPALRSNINYSCRGEKLESVIGYLSKTTGYDFIYSRDLVDISKTISLNARNQSIEDVLASIEKQANVSFKLKDHHIIVKNAPKPAPSKTITAPVIYPAEPELITSTSKTIPVVPYESHTTLLQNSLEKRIKEVQGMLGQVTPKNISPRDISQINFNNRHKNWYASIGTHVGDDHMGIELQAGLPAIYVVFTPHFSDGFYGSYGIGNSFNLTGNFSLNTIYLYSARTTTEVSYPLMGPYMGTDPEVVRTQIVHQHQVKVAIRYSFSENLSVRVGPVLNYRATLKEISVDFNQGMPETRRFESRNSRTVETWIGWDASIQYRINFFENK